MPETRPACSTPLPANESDRLRALYRYEVLDTEPEVAFDSLTQLAAAICQTPIALITLVDRDRQWFKARVGLDAAETPRDAAFCTQVILQSGPFVVLDASQDERFSDNPYVLAEPHIRFYAGVPLVTPDAYPLGTLCVIDRVPRQIDEQQIRGLEILAQQVVSLLELRRNQAELLQISHQQQRAIADQQRSEADLRLTQEHLHHLLAATPAVVYSSRMVPGYPLTFISENALDLLGYRVEQFFEHPAFWLEHVHPEDRDRWVARLSESLAPEPSCHEYRFLHGDGTYHWLRDECRLVPGPAQEPPEIVGYRVDITSTKQVEQQLRHSDESLRLLLASVKDCSLLLLDACGRVTRWSTGAEEMYGYPASEVLGQSPQKLWPEASEARSLEIASSQGSHDAEGWHRRKDGSQFWAHAVTTALRDEQGQLCGFAIVIRDITARRQMEVGLQETLQMQRAILDSANYMVISTAVDGTIQTFNAAAQAWLGYRLEEVLGSQTPLAIHDPQEVAERSRSLSQELGCVIEPGFEVFVAKARRGEAEEREWTYIRKDGTRFPVLLSVTALRDDAGNLTGFLGIGSDITARKQAERALQSSLKKLADFKFAMDQSSIVVITNPQGEIRNVNDKFCQISQFAREDLIGQNHRIVNSGYHPPQFFQTLWQTLNRGDVWQGEIRNRAKDGSVYWLYSTLVPLIAETGHPYEYVAFSQDITERKRMEEERDRFFTLSLDMLCIAGFDGHFRRLNPSFEKVLGYSNTELMAHSFKDWIHPEDWPATEAVLSKLWEGGLVINFENRYRHQDGTYRWFSWMASATPETELIYAIARDITEQKRTEEQLRESEARFRMVAQATNDAVWDWNLASNQVFWNEAIQTLFHYPAEAVGVEAIWWYEHIHPQDRDRVVSSMHAAIEHGQQSWSSEYRFRRWDGTYAHVLDRGYVVHDDWGTPIHMIGAMMDITERKEAEQKIREQAALLDITTDAIIVRSLDHRILFWNKGAERLYGWSAKSVLNKNANQILYRTPDQLPSEVFQSLDKRGEWHGELQQVQRDGQEIVVESRWTLVRNERREPTSILVVNTDITERKQLEGQFLRAQRMESIGTLAGGIAHDLNNVLAPILMSIQLLSTKLPDQASQRLLTTLEVSAKRGADLVRQVLSFAKGLEGRRTTLQIGHLLLEVEKIIRETFPKLLEIETDVSARTLWTVSGDVTQLHQVLMNLCVNARDAMPQGGTLTIAAENQLIDENYVRMNIDAQVGPYVVITIADTGMGIAPQILDRIFEPFFTTKERGKGTGLGLSTVMGIVKGHGGFINVYSEVGKGTRFRVYLPAVDTDLDPLAEFDQVPLPMGQGELVLVAEDEASIAEITKASLAVYNYRTVMAQDGIEAIALYAQHQQEVAVALIDMMMPLMDGLTTIRTLQRINPQLKIIVASGLSSNRRALDNAGLRIDAFLAKPFTAEDLILTLHAVLSDCPLDPPELESGDLSPDLL